MVETATRQVHRSTKTLLEAAKRPGETFDAPIRRHLKAAEAQEHQALLAEVESLLKDDENIHPLR